MRALNFTLIKLSICLIAGILMGFYLTISVKTALTVIVFFLVILLVLLRVAKLQFNKTIWFGLCAYLTMVATGGLTVTLHDQKLKKNHYSNYIINSADSLHVITFKIRETLKPNAYNKKYIVNVIELNNKPATGKLLLNISNGRFNLDLKVDEVFVYKAKLQSIPNPVNPYQFNYKAYLKRQYIYHQLFAEGLLLLPICQDTSTLFGVADNIRNRINTTLEPYFKPEQLAIINALFLGQRQDIDKNTYSNYVNAGAIHILAISGLHIGIILLLLNVCFKPLEKLKHGVFIKTILLVFILWCFAFIAGLSSSVTRAVTMFSLFAITLNLKRPYNTYNTLVLSLFILLLIKPLFLFDIGFQFSFLAVFAIISIDPLLYGLWQPKFFITDKLWHTLTVTLSAQLGVLPLGLFYFNQFPGLFFISNLVIIPCLSFILGLGLLVIILAVANCLPDLLANFFAFLIDGLNGFIAWVASQESFVIKNIALNFCQALALYALIICSVSFFKKYSYSRCTLLLIAIVLFQLSFFYTAYNKPNNSFIVFNKNKFSLFGQVINNSIVVSHNLDSLAIASDNSIRNYCIGSHIKTVKTNNIKSVYILNSKKILVVDSLGIYNVKAFSPDYVILRQSPKISLNRFIDSLKPKQVIADASNYKSYISYWEQTCKKRKIPFHYTAEKGAFILNY